MLLSRSIYIAAILVVPIAASAQLKESAGAASTKPPAPRVAQTAPEHDGGHNQAVQQAADRLPLSPSIKALRNQEPPDPKRQPDRSR